MEQIRANALLVIPLGRQGENLARQIIFDISCWAKEFGPGIPQLIHQRAGDDNPYPVKVNVNENLVLWEPTNADTYVASEYGRCELRYYVGDILVKSKTWLTIVEPSITSSVGEEAPSAAQSWVDQVIAAGAAAMTAANGAKADADRAAALAAEVSKKAAQTAQEASDAAKAMEAAQTAQRLAEEAQSAAEAARTAAAAAQAAVAQSATDAAAAKHGAETALQSAQDAAAAAANALESIQTLYQEMQTWAQGVIQDVNAAGSAAVQSVQSAGDAQVQRVTAEGTTQTANAKSQADAAAQSADSAAQSAHQAAESAAVYDTVVADVTQLKADIADLRYTNNLLTGKEYVWNKVFTSSAFDSEYYFYVKNIDVKKDVTYKTNKEVRFVTYLDTFQFEDIESTKTFTPDRDCKVNITFYKKGVSADYLSYDKDYKLCESTIDFLDVVPKGEYWIPSNYIPKYFDEISNDFVKTESINLFDPSVSKGGTLQSNGAVIANSNYKTTGFIPINKDTYYTISPSIRFLLRYDANKEIISGSYVDTEKTNYTFSQSVDGFVRFTYYVTDQNSQIISVGDKPTKYVPYGDRKISEDISLSNKQTESVLSVGNVLYNKKWCACGDSFTAWTTETYKGSDYPNITNKDGNYKTYPFWIGSRNNMTVLNYAQSGETITTPTGTYSNIAFTNNIYKTIPLDVDYITLWFGINDASHIRGDSQEGESVDGTITLGTIDDTSVNTFYGAWNTVCEYLLTNYPYAHIGIIITNGTQNPDIVNAEIAIAQKWGIAYLDLNGDYKVPLMNRVDGKANVCEKAKQLRKSAFQVPETETGAWHPNVKAHEYESTFIENFLRSI